MLESTLKGNCMLKENWRKDMAEGKGEAGTVDLNRIEGLTMNNFNKQQNKSNLMLPITSNVNDGGDSVYSAGI